MTTFIAAVLALLGSLAGAHAAEAGDAERVRCAHRLDQAVYTLARAVNLTASECLQRAARSGVPPALTLAECVTADASGRIANSADRLVTVDGAECTERPSFAAALVDVAREMTPAEGASLLDDLFGADAFETFAVDALTADTERCARTVTRFASKLRLAALRDYFDCKKRVLESAAFSDPQAVVDCFAASARRERALARDGDGVADACVDLDTNSVLPGACAGSADLAACVSRRAVCRACRAETATDHVGADCDTRDDGESNDSCPNTFVQPCGNGVLDPGEKCDDYNLSDADCCSSACAPVAAGAPCPDDADLCTTDLCTGTGVCAHASQCAWAFTDGTDAAGIDVVHSYDETAIENPELEAAIEVGGAAAADYDGDGWVDVYFVGGTDGANYLLHNEGDGTFEDRAAAAGVALAGTMSCGPAFADIDGDGDSDLFVGGVNETPLGVFRNAGDGTFEDVTATAGIALTGFPQGKHAVFSGAFGDYDRDDDLDLFLASWFRLTATEDRLWQNQGDGTFADVTAAAGVSVSRDPNSLDWSFTPNFTDIDNDGFQDLLVTCDFGTSEVFHNAGDGTFDHATTTVITDENGMGAAPADFDNDGDIDWFVTSILDPNGVPEAHWGVSGNRFYRNKGNGKFEDVTDEAGVRDGGWGWGSCAADFNLDGYLDIFHVNGFTAVQATEFFEDSSRLFISRGDGTFEERAVELGIDDTDQGRGVACFDYDGDGDVDVFVSNNDQPARLWRNGAETLGNGYLHVSVHGPGKNTQGIGARVYVTIGATTQLREIRAGSNFESQDPPIAYFGIGKAASIDELRVVWPDGATTSLAGVTPNQSLTIEHP